jgi:hypothetical protein
MDKVGNYLSLAKIVGRSGEGPVPLAVKINLDDELRNLISVINSEGVFVNLDLSRCTMEGSEFKPGNSGSPYIASLVLPNSAESVSGNFGVFSDLINIRLKASVNIEGENPFAGCSLLTFNLRGRGDLSVIEQGKALVRGGSELVSYPSASGSLTLDGITSIGNSAFSRSDLESVNLPAAGNIGVMAFRGCESLESANLPAAAVIDDEAFRGNSSLTTLNIPAAGTIGNNVAANTGNVGLTITVGPQLKTIGIGMFNEVGSRKNVVIKAPQSEVENITAMRDAIRGRGWNEGAFRLAAQWTSGSGWSQRTGNNYNTNINLTVEGY